MSDEYLGGRMVFKGDATFLELVDHSFKDQPSGAELARSAPVPSGGSRMSHLAQCSRKNLGSHLVIPTT